MIYKKSCHSCFNFRIVIYILKPREKFVIVSPGQDDNNVRVQKRDKKFTARQYDIPKHQLLKVPRRAALKAKQNIAEWTKLCSVSVKKKKSAVKLHAWEHGDDDEDPTFHTMKPLLMEDEEDFDPSNETTNSERSTTTDHEHEETSTESEDDSFRLVDNERIADWGGDDDEDDEDSTPQEELFHDAEENGSPDNCPGPGLLRNILEDNRTFLKIHPKKPDRTDDQKVRNPIIVRRSSRQAEQPDYRELHGIRKYRKQ